LTKKTEQRFWRQGTWLSPRKTQKRRSPIGGTKDTARKETEKKGKEDPSLSMRGGRKKTGNRAMGRRGGTGMQIIGSIILRGI